VDGAFLFAFEGGEFTQLEEGAGYKGGVREATNKGGEGVVGLVEGFGHSEGEGVEEEGVLGERGVAIGEVFGLEGGLGIVLAFEIEGGDSQGEDFGLLMGVAFDFAEGGDGSGQVREVLQLYFREEDMGILAQCGEGAFSDELGIKLCGARGVMGVQIIGVGGAFEDA
jgi:hypothetical protein